MKKLHLSIITLVVLMLFSFKVNAQTTPASYYKGKWDILIKGTPEGDKHLIFNLADSAETVNGSFVDPDTNTDVAITKSEFADGKPTFYFTVKGYDVSLVLEKKDDDHVAGSLMGMFEVTGERVKKQE